MNTLISLCLFALFSVILLRITQDLAAPLRFGILIASSVVFFSFYILQLLPVIQSIMTLTDIPEANSIFKILFKGLGIALLTQICSDFCRDFGEDSIASKLELGGKCAILSLSIPIFSKILELVGELTS